MHDVTIIADRSVSAAGPLVAGANKVGYHLRNVVLGRDWQATQIADIAQVRDGDACPRCGQPLAFERGSVIGRLHRLDTELAASLDATYLDLNGVARPIAMGAWRLAIEPLLYAIIEQHHDDAGIIWPAAVAPFSVHLVRLGKKPATHAAADALYAELRAAGLEVLYDDRDESAGVKFNDADLIGLPTRVLVSDRLLAADEVEIKPRDGEAFKVAREEAVAAISVWVAADRSGDLT